MKKVLNATQKLLSYSMVFLSAFAVYKGSTDVAIYLILAALYTRNTIDATIIVLNDGDKEAKE